MAKRNGRPPINEFSNLAIATHAMWDDALSTGRRHYMVQRGDKILVTSSPHKVLGKVMGGSRDRGCLR